MSDSDYTAPCDYDVLAAAEPLCAD